MAEAIPYKYYKVSEGNGRTGYYAIASTNTPHGYQEISSQEFSSGLQQELGKEKTYVTSQQAQAQGLGAGARYDQNRIDLLTSTLDQFNQGKYAGPSDYVVATDPLTGQNNQMSVDAYQNIQKEQAGLASGELVKTGQEGVYVPAGSAALQELQQPGSTGTTTLPGPTNPVKVGGSEGPGAAAAAPVQQPAQATAGVAGAQPTAQPSAQTGAQPAATSNIPQIASNLGPGSTGAEVAALQNWLISQGYSIPAIQNGTAQPGYYGDQTMAAVTQWQKDNGIIPDNAADYGYFGPKSRGVLSQLGTQTQGQGMGVSGDSQMLGPATESEITGGNMLSETIDSLRALYGLDPAGSGKTPVEQALSDYQEIYKSLGISDIKKSYEEATKEFASVQEELGDRIADINEDPWLTEGVRQNRINKLKERYETKLQIATNKMQLFDSLAKQGMAQAENVIGLMNGQQARSDAIVGQAIDLVQKQIDAQKKLAEIDPSQYREVQGGLYDIKNNKWIVPPKPETPAGGDGGIDGGVKLTASQKTAQDNLNSVLTSLQTYRALYDSKVGPTGINLTGADAGELSGAYNALMFQIAQAAGTGALQAADREVVENMIPNPTTLSGAAGGFIKGGKQGGLGAIDQASILFQNRLNAIGSGSYTPQPLQFNPYASEYSASEDELMGLNANSFSSTPATSSGNTGIIGWLMGN